MKMQDVTVGVVGGGTVGRATARAWAGFANDVRVWDVLPERCTVPYEWNVWECDLIFICLPEGELGTYFGALPDRRRANSWVLKSTVPIGTTRRLREQYNLPNLVHSPEFLSERTALLDAQMPARNIIGDPDWDNDPADYGSFADELVKLYQQRFPGVPVFRMTSEESEAVKLFQNGFSAIKIAAFNEFRCLADKMGLDWERMREALLAGGWINPMHTQVPGPDGKRGFGGKCLPKDLATLVKHLEDTGLLTNETRTISDVSMCLAALDRNKWDRGIES